MTDSLPKPFKPMMAGNSYRPERLKNPVFEPKWDGYRALLFWDGGEARFWSRNLNELTGQFPELLGVRDYLPEGTTLVLDGEIVAFNHRAIPKFGLLQRRPKLAAAVTVAEGTIKYLAFDLVYLDGNWLNDLPYAKRRAALEQLELDGEAIQTPPNLGTDLDTATEVAQQMGLEGLVAKDTEDRYILGHRNDSWQKIKFSHRQEFVVGGWVPRKGSENLLGSLLLGYYSEGDNRLTSAGGLGTGFDERELEQLSQRVSSLATDESPFAGPIDRKGARFVRPELVVEVEFREWTRDGQLRHASYRGTREDKDPRDVIKES